MSFETSPNINTEKEEPVIVEVGEETAKLTQAEQAQRLKTLELQKKLREAKSEKTPEKIYNLN